MNEPTTDEKIQHLVRAVLDAVDTRLDGVRHELAVFAGDVERRHHQVLDIIAAMEARVDRLERADHDQAAATTAARAAAHSVDDRLEHLQTRLDRLETDAHAAMTAAAHAADLAEISKPLYSGGHVTSQLPIVTDPAIHEITSLPLPPAIPPTMTSPTHPAPAVAPVAASPAAVAPTDPPSTSDDITDEIDLEQLTNLLNERLGHLELPTRPETRPDVPPAG